jgi:hypothetical protein
MAKAVVGIALALRFAHGLGLLHGALDVGNVLFDADRRIQIADFSPFRLESGEVEPFAGEQWTPAGDVSGFRHILFLIANYTAVELAVPAFFSLMIDMAGSPDPQWQLLPDPHGRVSFVDIVERLKMKDFRIVPGVDAEEVSAFVAWVESAEQSGNWE